MKALTILQPWAHLIAIGAKTIETRSWETTYRGPLAIHASANTKFIAFHGKHCITDQEPFRSALLASFKAGRVMWPGMVIAICRLIGCYKIAPIPKGLKANPEIFSEQELAFGDYTPGRYAWLLSDVKKLPSPIPAKGALGLWNWNCPHDWCEASQPGCWICSMCGLFVPDGGRDENLGALL